MIHKRLIPLFALLPFTAILSLTTGCRDESGSPQGNGTSLQVASVSTKAEVAVSASTVQRSSSTLRSATELTSGDIGVYRIANTGVYTAQSNVKYTCTSGIWAEASGVTPIYLYSATASVCAYYPYSATIGDDPTTTDTTEANAPTAIPLTSQLYSTAADLCYATSVTPSSASPSVSFTMNRAYAKMTFTITHDASYSGTCAVTGITIANAGIRSSNTLNITTGNYGSTTASGSVTVTPTDITSIASGSSATATVLMVPTMTGTTAATLSGNMTFLFTVDGTTHAATLPVSTNNLTTLAAGSNYQIAVNISGSGFSVAMGSTAGSGSSIMGATANCYIVAPSASITIPVNVKGNGGNVAGTGLSTTHTAASVGIVWQTAAGLITLGTFDVACQTITINANTSGTSGNAVIAAYSGATQTGDVLWSWHIWVTSYNPNTGTIYRFNTNNLLTFMDRNLGATTTTAATLTTMGLLYQWGRKDPFPGASAYTGITDGTYSSLPIYNASGTQLTEGSPTGGTGINSVVASATTTETKTLNLTNAIKNPMNFYYATTGGTYIGRDWYTTTNDATGSLQNPALWGSSVYTGSPTTKTIFDPCPAGWRVPTWKSSYSPWDVFGTSTPNAYVATSTVGTFNYGLTVTSVSAGYYPAAGYRNPGSGALSLVGNNGYCWSGSLISGFGFDLGFFISSLYPANYNDRAYGFSVRCVQEF